MDEEVEVPGSGRRPVRRPRRTWRRVQQDLEVLKIAKGLTMNQISGGGPPQVQP